MKLCVLNTQFIFLSIWMLQFFLSTCTWIRGKYVTKMMPTLEKCVDKLTWREAKKLRAHLSIHPIQRITCFFFGFLLVWIGFARVCVCMQLFWLSGKKEYELARGNWNEAKSTEIMLIKLSCHSMCRSSTFFFFFQHEQKGCN